MQISNHAAAQAARRSVSTKDIEYVIQNGSESCQYGGRTLFFCGRRTKKPSARNLAVILASDGAVVTVIRTATIRRLRAKVPKGHAFHV